MDFFRLAAADLALGRRASACGRSSCRREVSPDRAARWAALCVMVVPAAGCGLQQEFQPPAPNRCWARGRCRVRGCAAQARPMHSPHQPSGSPRWACSRDLLEGMSAAAPRHPSGLSSLANNSIHHWGKRLPQRIRQSGNALRKPIRSPAAAGLVAGSEAKDQVRLPHSSL